MLASSTQTQAARGLAAAVLNGTPAGGNSTERPTGRIITAIDTTITVADLLPDEAFQPLQSAVVANVPTAMISEHHTCAAVNASYICYGLPQGQVRTQT
jgi:hypothetical protein